MANVRLDRVTKVFRDRHRGEVKAVDEATFEVKDGEFLVLVGPSGCGKTTTLRMIAGLERQTAGDIYVGQRLVNLLHPKDRDIAMVFQDYALYPHMDVYDNLAFGLRNLRYPRDEIDRKIHGAAEMLQITHLLRRKPRELSGGQKQRVAVGRTIVRSPEVFLFDEPLSNLDAKLRVQMRIELAELHRRLGNTAVYVTHDQVEAMTMGDRIVVMNNGLIQQIGPPREIYEHPNNMFVAAFMGAPPMNLIEGDIESSGCFCSDGLTIALPPEVLSANPKIAGRRVVLGVRPDDIREAAPGTAAGIATGTVKAVEYLGSETLAYVVLGSAGVIARLNPQTGASPDSSLAVGIDFSRASFFDPTSQERLN